MTILIYKMLLGILVISVIMATLDRSVLIFIEDNIPFVKQQQEEFMNLKRFRKQVDSAKNKLKNEKTRIKEDPEPANPLSSKDLAVLRSLEYADPKKDMGVNNASSFCRKTNDSIDDLEQRCKKLDGYSCNQVDCCVLLNGTKCVSGGSSGPNFGWTKPNGQQRSKTKSDFYYYKGKRM